MRRKSETKMPQNSRILKVTWADILWGTSYGPRGGFVAQTAPPRGPQRSENSQNKKIQNPGNHILRMSMGRSAMSMDPQLIPMDPSPDTPSFIFYHGGVSVTGGPTGPFTWLSSGCFEKSGFCKNIYGFGQSPLSPHPAR